MQKSIHNLNIGIELQKDQREDLNFTVGWRNKGMSLHIVPSFLLIYPLPLGSTHFEWQWTPIFLLATAHNPPFLHLSLKAQCPVLLLRLCEKVKDFSGSSTSVKLQGLIESHLEPLTQCTTQLTPPVEGNISTFTHLQPAQLGSFPRGIQFSALMRPGVLK